MARAALSEMQLRIAEGPYSALGLDHAATSEEVRAAFLGLTKQYHPARFGRMSSEIQRLSNEVFLGIKSAHDQLQKSLGGSVRGGSPNQRGAIPVQAEGTERGVGTPKRTGHVPFGGPVGPGGRGPQFRTQLGTPAPSSQQPAQPLARGTDRAATPPPAGQRPASQITPPAGAQRISSPALPRTTTPAAMPPRPGTPPSGIPAQRTTPPHGIPIQQRPATPARSSTPQPTPARGATPPGAAPPRPADLNPGTIRHSGAAAAPPSGAQPARPAGPAFDERATLRECMMLLNEKKWTDARVALHSLASKVPASKSYRALLCYARGREAHAAGRTDEAQLEYQRALQLEPELDLAKQAVAELTGRR